MGSRISFFALAKRENEMSNLIDHDIVNDCIFLSSSAHPTARTRRLRLVIGADDFFPPCRRGRLARLPIVAIHR
ncbi:hypothetical protein MES5069_310305 [Mesorhizobium escarrei]|uniref:LysR substrate-binding domain-containing protein n=1 Tax=Mesorhizobium escarrei TaxID=666018 RepID=A0ABM9E0G7_9HYPH|nr:hypothetical protein MES5069_310305 [Mesorhizobium escarrei]